MSSAQVINIDPDEFSRCEERGQITDHGKSLSPIQKTDAAIKETIYHAFWKDNFLRAVEYNEINVHVKNGVVYLNGHIVSTTSCNRVENAIRAIPGILEIKNNLVLDDKLTLEVAASLGNLEHTHGCKFFTGASHGVVSLNGIVSNENVKLLAEKCAASHPNVRGVINNVRVSGTELGLQSQPFLQPVIGEIIYFNDGIHGVVKQVIINPNNRRVTQLVIEGQFAGQKRDLMALTNNQARIVEETVVIPVNLIRYLTNSSGFLTIKSTEKTQYEDFNPLYFTAPQVDWAPPYPYCSEDILFNVDAQEIENQIMIDPDPEQLKVTAQPTLSRKPKIQVDVLSEWEDDGGKAIQTVETVSPNEVMHSSDTFGNVILEVQTLKEQLAANDSPGG